MCEGDLREVFVALMDHFTNSYGMYSSTEDTQEYFKERNILLSFRLLNMIKYYYKGPVKAL